MRFAICAQTISLYSSPTNLEDLLFFCQTKHSVKDGQLNKHLFKMFRFLGMEEVRLNLYSRPSWSFMKILSKIILLGPDGLRA